MTRAKHALAGVALALACVCAPPAAASDGVDQAAATGLFNAGRDLMKHGDYAAACPKLAESARLEATVGALAKLAECEEHEHRLASAYGRWQQALNLARAMGDTRGVDVERELARLEAIVPRLRVQASGALPPGTTLRVDDVELGPASLGVPLAVEPGKHVLQAIAPHKVPWTTTVETLADGGTTVVSIPDLEDAAAPAPVPSPAPVVASPPPPVPPTSAPGRVFGLATAGVGVGALAAGGVLGAVALQHRNAADCPGNVCPDAASAQTLSDAKTAASWSTVLFVAGGLLVGGGVTVWWLSRDHDAGGVRAVLTPGGLAGSF